MEILVYRENSTKLEEGFSLRQLPDLLEDETNFVWVDFEAPTEEEDNILATIFKFHPLTIEDCRADRNQPKVEQYGGYLFYILHGVRPEETNSSNFVTKELDGYLGKNYLVTYHHEKFRSIDNVKRQLHNTTYACQKGSAYVLHQIIDQIIDLYIPVMDDFDNNINELEEKIIERKIADKNILEEIMDIKRAVVRLKRISTKQLDVIYRMSHGEFPQIGEHNLPFYRDVYDHLLRVSDLAESYRDMVSGLLDAHFSIIATKTNEITKVLAIFSAILLPLSLIAGIYGMNFDNMPELKTKNGYYFVLGFMSLVAIGLLGYFWWRGWIWEKNKDE